MAAMFLSEYIKSGIRHLQIYGKREKTIFYLPRPLLCIAQRIPGKKCEPGLWPHMVGAGADA